MQSSKSKRAKDGDDSIRDFRDLFKDFFDAHDRIGECLWRRMKAGRNLDTADFPSTPSEAKAWAQFTAPEMLESFTELSAILPLADGVSKQLWDKAFAACRANAEAKTLAGAH